MYQVHRKNEKRKCPRSRSAVVMFEISKIGVTDEEDGLLMINQVSEVQIA